MTKDVNRSPIIQNRVNEYLLITLISFAGSVSLTRLFLYITGYPQIGGGELHFAHVLWGGLFLFLGTLLPIVFSNRWSLDFSALFSGIGIGLFIDEVGKFITQNNNYFYPSAAPIIYAFFLLTVLLYLELIRPKQKTSRVLLYECFQELEEMLDNDLSIKEHRNVILKLNQIIDNGESNNREKMLATTISQYLLNQEDIIVPHKPSFYEKWSFRIRKFESKWMTKKRTRLLLSGLLLIWGIYTVAEPFILFKAINSPETIENILQNLINQNLVKNESGLTWYQAQIGLEGVLGILGIISGFLMLIQKDQIGTKIGIATLLVMLSFANLLLFYFDQFSSIIPASVQLFLLLVSIRYNRMIQE
jgi:hypothetical protein